MRVLGYYNAYAVIALPNPVSVALHEGLGFNPVGVYPSVGFKLGQWHDLGIWQLALQKHSFPLSLHGYLEMCSILQSGDKPSKMA